AFLLRRYLTHDDPGASETLGLALAQSLVFAESESTVIGRAGWLSLLVDASAIADDDRIVPAAVALIHLLQAEWPDRWRIDEMAASIEACLRASPLVDRDELVADAIDHLERVISGS